MALGMDGLGDFLLGNDMRPTYLCIEDIEDAPNPPRDLKQEQKDNLQAALGLALWADLEQKLMEKENGN